MKASRFIFIGYNEELQGSVVINPQSNKTIQSRYVLFKEKDDWENDKWSSIKKSVTSATPIKLLSSDDKWYHHLNNMLSENQKVQILEADCEERSSNVYTREEMDDLVEVDGILDKDLVSSLPHVYVTSTANHNNIQDVEKVNMLKSQRQDLKDWDRGRDSRESWS